HCVALRRSESVLLTARPPGGRRRRKGPEVPDPHGTSYGPDNLRPLPTRAALTLSPAGEGTYETQLVASAGCSSSGLSFSTDCSLSFARESRFRLTSLSTRLADTLK